MVPSSGQPPLPRRELRASVVICTLDRAALLGDCLDAVLADLPDDGSMEIVVVDNGSTDGTRAVVESRPGVRYVLEPRRGVSHARNAGLEVAASDLVAFVDDDIRPEPGWAAALLDARARHPDVVAIGGPVVLRWPATPPAWLRPPVTRWLSEVDHGPTPRFIEPHEQLVCANLALVRSAAMGAGGFRTELGRSGSSLISGEEVELVRRLQAGGGAVWWEPTVIAHHVVPRARMRRRWLVRRAFAQGRSDFVMDGLDGSPPERNLKGALGAVVRGWPATIRRVRSAPSPSFEATRELLHRARRVGRALG